MTEYRAVLKGVKSNRPVQMICTIRSAADAWAANVLRIEPNGIVEIYESKEVLVARHSGTERTERAKGGACLDCDHSGAAHLKSASTNNIKHGACAMCRCPQYRRSDAAPA